MSNFQKPKHYSDPDKVDMQQLIFFLMKQGYSQSYVGVKDYILSKGDFAVLPKEGTVTYKQVKEFFERHNLNLDDFNMTLEAANNLKECKEFIDSLDDDKKPDL